MPLGAFRPRLCLTKRAGDVRAAMLFLMLGLLIPNFITSPAIRFVLTTWRQRTAPRQTIGRLDQECKPLPDSPSGTLPWREHR